MGRPCSVCVHKDVGAINEGLLSGATFRKLAEQFGTSSTALFRHKGEHLPVTLTKAKDAEVVASADALFAKVGGYIIRAERILDSAEEAGLLPVALLALREARSCLELLVRIRGDVAAPAAGEACEIRIIRDDDWRGGGEGNAQK